MTFRRAGFVAFVVIGLGCAGSGTSEPAVAGPFTVSRIDGRCAFVGPNGETTPVVEARSCARAGDDVLAAIDKGEWRLIGADGAVRGTFSTLGGRYPILREKELAGAASGVVPACRGRDECGLVALDGTWRAEPVRVDVGAVTGGFAVMRSGPEEKYGVLAADGSVAVEPSYDLLGRFDDTGVAIAARKAECADPQDPNCLASWYTFELIDGKGSRRVDLGRRVFADDLAALDFVDGRAKVPKDGGWESVDANGAIAVTP